ncbi:MAG TPA: hypothetical protein VMJ10_05900 [Kofleriaceae bacterium]|nr:hypothetical protein [Kofleriaceae bacterium]
MVRFAGMAALALVFACGHGGSAAPPAPRDAAVTGSRDAAPLELPARPLGLAALADYGWRKRPGQRAFREARAAEARGDWPGVLAACERALAADPGHLDARWLDAIALAHASRLGDVLAPLDAAAAGDYGKWTPAALEHPALQAFLATPTGDAWKRRAERDRADYLAALARALVVASMGDLYAYDPQTTRWHRLTRTQGAVVTAFAAPAGAHRIAYVTRDRAGKLAVGLVELDTGHTTHAVDLGITATAAAPLAIAYGDKPTGFWIGTGGGAQAWRVLDDTGALHALPARLPRPSGAWLEVHAHGARLHRLPANVAADWDDQELASALRVGSSNRVVSVPNAGMIDGNTIVWSPDRGHLAFVAQDEQCAAGKPATALFVADAATGTARELGQRGDGGYALEWLGDGRLAIAADRGVSIVDLAGGAPLTFDHASLLAPRHRPRCAPEPAENSEPEPEPEPEPEN